MSAAHCSSWVIYGIRLADVSYYSYVGYTSKGAQHRFEQHLGHARRQSKKSFSDRSDKRHHTTWFIKHLDDDLTVDVLEYCPEGDWNYLAEAEERWIRTLRELGHDLKNHSIGGKGGRGYSHSDESKAKISAGLRYPDGTSKMLGKTHSEESKRKMSESHKGVPLTSQCKATMSDGRRKTSNHHLWNKGHSPETIEKLRQVSTGRIQSESTKLKRSITQKGVPKSSGHTKYHAANNILVPKCPWCEDLVVNIRLEFSSPDEIRKIHKNYVG